MNEALIFFIITLALFVAGMYFASPLIGLNTNGYSTSRITNNITVTTITRNGETYTVTVPKNIGSSRNTEVEKLEIVNAYAEKSNDGWYVYVLVKNTGTKPATVDQIFINNQPYATASISYATGDSAPGTGSATESFSDAVSIDTGDYALFKIILSENEYTSGQTISIVIHTASGGQYPATVTLP